MRAPINAVKRMVGVSILLVATFIVALLLLLWALQERIVFQPSGPPYPVVAADRVEYRAEDGQELYAYVVGSRDDASPGVLLTFHGNADLAIRLYPWAQEVRRRTGWTVMLAEYRGYGGLSGVPSVAGVRLDARAAARYAIDSLLAHPPRLALYGHSLGSAIAAELAGEIPVSRLILESPFTSAREMARIIVSRPIDAMWSMISRVHYDTRARVGELTGPVSVVHGDRDIVIPVRMGRAVFQSARNPGELLIIEGAGHNDVAEEGGERYWTWLARALVNGQRR